MSIQVCRDPADAVALYLPQSLFLKSFARLNISVQLPTHKVHGKSISNWELMEKLRKMIQPDSFSLLKVVKNSSEVIRFDAELESREKLGRVLARLEDRVVQLTDYPDPLRVRVAEAKSDFPSRHSWDSFFRDAKDMDEMKPGERPDTIHIKNLPIPWFVSSKDRHSDPLPSESICKKVFEKYGDIRQIDIPASDPYRMQMKEAMRGVTIPPQESALFFEAYVQFSEYVGFVRCMDALRGCKLLRKKEDLAEWCSIHVNFDKTKHMTDAAVKRRAIVRERLASRQRAKELEEKEERERISNKEARERLKSERAEREKLEKMREREERRKKKQLAKLMERDDVNLNKQVAEEQHKLLKVQKKLQAIRLIEELFRRIELRPETQHNGRTYYSAAEHSARARIVDRMKQQQERLLDKQRDQLRHAMNGRIVIRSALETTKPKRSPSVSSLSSEEGQRNKVKTEKVTSPDIHEVDMKTAAGMYGVPNPYAFGVPNPYHFSAHPGYPYPQTSMYYPVRGAYYPPPDSYRRARARGRGRGRGVRVPFFDGPDATHKYYKYFKRLTETEHDHRSRSRSRSRRRSYSRSRSRRRSYSRSRSHRSRSRSRSRSRRSRSHSRRSRSHSRRRERSRGRRSRSDHTRSKSHSRRSRSKTRSKSKLRTPSPKDSQTKEQGSGENRRSWSKTPEDK